MEREAIHTPHGVVPITGWMSKFHADRPLILFVRGAYPAAESMHQMPGLLSEADVVIVDLPGMLSPFFATQSVEAFGAAYDEVIARRFPGRRSVAVGLSTGALASLAMQTPDYLVLLEPPLETAALWPLIPRLEEEIRRTALAEARDWVAGIFGVTLEGVFGRDYRHMLASCHKPGAVLVGGVPLDPPRELETFPSFVTADALDMIIRHPSLRMALVGSVGHNIVDRAPAALLREIKAGIRFLEEAPATSAG